MSTGPGGWALALAGLLVGCSEGSVQQHAATASPALRDTLLTLFDSIVTIHQAAPDTALIRRMHPEADTIMFVPWPGLLLGAALFLVLALQPPGAARSAMEGTPDPPIVTGMLFLSLFLLFGVGLEWRWASWCRRAVSLHGRRLSAAPVQGEGACAGPDEGPTRTS